ncbi:MAG TPA: glucose-6-phosphate dehydrogenase, partial [Solirubrobacteraceae bacterium]
MSATSPLSAADTENPLVAGLERLPVHPTSLVIFGATGDLAHRKLLPAIYNLAHEGQLPERFEVIGVGRRTHEDEEFRDTVTDSIEKFSRRRPDPNVMQGLLNEARYVQGSFDDDSVYAELVRELDGFDQAAGRPLDRVFYLSTAPEFFPLIAGKLGAAGLNRTDRASVRIVIEKPFGYDLASARALNAELLEVFEEHQIFRIDHYLGKETVQNLLALRFANGIFEPIWNRQFIDHVQITVAESIGIEGRAGYYEQAGAIRDIFQNHLLQLLALTAMEPPIDFTAESVRNEKVKVLKALHTPGPKHVVRGQYGRGFVEGVEVKGYREEDGVAP